MVRELAIFLFLFVFKCVFYFCRLFPLKDKTTFVVSFGDNSKYVFEEMRRQNITSEVVFLCKGKSLSLFKDYDGTKVIPFETTRIFQWFRSIYHIATSRFVMVDNYYGFLAAIKFRQDVECIQLWHASGALKKFGLEDESIKYRSAKAKQRFLNVYDKFNKVVVGSDIMANIFIKSFQLTKDRILTTGVPRTDFYFDEQAMKEAKTKLFNEHEQMKNKKIILYAPTYRDHEIDHLNLKLDIESMYQQLGTEYILLLRLHPAIRNQLSLTNRFSDFVVDCSSSQYDINELLIAADYLITDYSSIPFEFSLLRKPIIFFTYDLEEYKQKRGVMEGFEENLPGPIVRDTDGIIHLIMQNHFDLAKVNRYAELWNKYSTGNSSRRLVSYMFAKQSINQQQTSVKG